ncbi:MAG: peptidoglycan editing factor PgeF [Burkholderiales bacterium]|nr:peptidoglycan editing factor PgeF [Burkholderiales bacterium]
MITGTSGAAERLRERLAADGLDWIVPGWAAPEGVVALSTTRNGGVSTGACASMDLGPARVRDAADRAAILANRALFAGYAPAAPVYLAQVHGTRVVTIGPDDLAACAADPPEADAAVTRDRGVVLAVRTADCLPVVFADRDATVVGIAHAGWRGLAAGVLEAALAAMHVDAARVVAWVGPGIGPGAFEVGRDVVDAFVTRASEDADCFAPREDGKWMADLPVLAQRRLLRAGVRDVAGGAWCTHADERRFHSWRRDQSAGRMATAVWIEP